MRSRHPAELIIGSVQLGLAYGAANRTGKPDHQTALRLVRRAADDPRVGGFDTAWAYGDSEDRLGEALHPLEEALKARGVRTITKLSPLSELTAGSSETEINIRVDKSIEKSLQALRRTTLDCVLLHRAVHMTEYGGAVWKRLEYHLAEGRVKALGVSVQSPKEALEALERHKVHHLQLAFNILDWRWAEADAISVIRKKRKVTVHARSVFLQGVLAAGDPSVWPRVAGVKPPELIDWLNRSTKKFGRESVADLCLAYVRGQDWIDGVVVGMETEAQLETNLALNERPPLTAKECAAIARSRPPIPEQLLDPARWPRP